MIHVFAFLVDVDYCVLIHIVFHKIMFRLRKSDTSMNSIHLTHIPSKGNTYGVMIPPLIHSQTAMVQRCYVCNFSRDATAILSSLMDFGFPC